MCILYIAPGVQEVLSNFHSKLNLYIWRGLIGLTVYSPKNDSISSFFSSRHCPHNSAQPSFKSSCLGKPQKSFSTNSHAVNRGVGRPGHFL